MSNNFYVVKNYYIYSRYS